MEKIVYALWRDQSVQRDAFNRNLLDVVAPRLKDKVAALRINVQDKEVEGGNSSRFTATDPQMEAVVQMWVKSAHREAAGIEEILRDAASRFSGWLVAESQVIPNDLHPSSGQGRTYGFSQIVFLSVPSTLTAEGWRDIWQNSHSQIAIDTQANFEYVQNLVVRPLTYGAAPYGAMIEECFPPEALHDPAVFYDAVGNPERLAENVRLMMESCARFIDPKKIDCIPTSQFEVKPLQG